jgi:transglutaminase-like putative cysteine protease
MQYVVRHLTRFVYSSPVSESVMELRMQPLDRERQRCLRFDITTSQRAKVFAYRDHYGNAVHYFDVPGHHGRLDVTVESVVDVDPVPPLPKHFPAEAWQDIDALADTGLFLDWLLPSTFTTPTEALQQFALAIGLSRRDDPLTTLRSLNTMLYQQFAYEPKTTHVDSPIDEALRLRAGVCQDFSHIMAALVRGLGIPCRYVSGYIAPRESRHDRAGDNATHAWIEAWLPPLGWIGFDPTNNTIAGHRHIVVAVGRDYHEVPPTRGIYKGGAGSELSVAVSVTPGTAVVPPRELSPEVSWIAPPRSDSLVDDEAALLQQQQQQQ